MQGSLFSTMLPGLRLPHVAQLTCLRTLASAWTACAAYASKSDGTLPRFYKHVGVRPDQAQEGYQVTLDGRALKTPARKALVLPSYPLALAVAAEWEWQDARKIRPFTMPLMSLAATAIDQPKPRQLVIASLAEYLYSDACCCRNEHGALADRQALMFDLVLSWARQQFRADFAVSTSIFGVEHSPDAVAQVQQHLQGLDSWRLAAVEALAGACRSVLLGLAIMQGKLGVADAIKAARLEEHWQVEEWGLVEGGHDIDEADINVRVTAPIAFLRLLPKPQLLSSQPMQPGTNAT